MDRPIVYTSEQGRSTDFLFGQRAAMIGLAKLAKAVLGTGPWVEGLTASPTSPASLAVNISSGQIYQLEHVDATAYGSLAADTTDQILKQGLSMATVTPGTPAPTTSGYSINYLIQATYQDQDNAPLVLPYFNSANPSQPLSGQNNSGAAQPTQRQGVCVISAKAGAAAATGSQTTPAPDSGYVGLWVVTVAYGQTSITASNITQYTGAPFIPTVLTQAAGLALPNIFTAPQEVNAPAGTTGNLLALLLAGASKLTLDVNGNMIIPGTASVAPATASGHAVNLGQFERVSYYSATQSGSFAAAASTTTNIAAVTITFPTFSKTGAFRVRASLIMAGSASASGAFANFLGQITDGTTLVSGANWLVYAPSSGDSIGTSDSLDMGVGYSPGTSATFTYKLSTSSSGFSVSGSSLKLVMEEA